MKSSRKSPFCSKCRSARGLALATVNLMVIVPISLLIMFLVVDAGVSTYYKEKLGFATEQSAKFGASLPPDIDLQNQTEQVAKALLSSMGLVDPQGTVDVQRTTVGGNPCVQVTIKLALPLIEGSTVLPTTIVLQETATSASASSGTSYRGQLFHFDRTTGRPVYIPIVRGDSSLPAFFCDEPAGLNPFLGPGVP